MAILFSKSRLDLRMVCFSRLIPPRDAREYHYMDTTFAFVGLKIRPSHFLKYIEYLIKFVVHEGKANEPIAEFIRGIKDLPEWTFGAQEEVRLLARNYSHLGTYPRQADTRVERVLECTFI